MRSHGVPDFPNPTGNSGVAFPRGDLKVTESRLQTAEDDCQHLLPSGGQPFHAEQQQESDELNFARCVRSHGVPDWPDPTNMGGGEYEFNLRLVGIDPNSPQAEAAERECQSQLHLSRSQLHLPQTGPTTGGVKVAGEP
jgi:hypothetical protein